MLFADISKTIRLNNTIIRIKMFFYHYLYLRILKIKSILFLSSYLTFSNFKNY